MSPSPLDGVAEKGVVAAASAGFAVGLSAAYHLASQATIPNVTYVTDVEGNYEYWGRFLEKSEGIIIKSVSHDGIFDLELKDGWHFVFGGDSCDKGGKVGGSVRVVRSLVAVKKKYPSRVTLLLGNRDLNKMRLTSELAADQLAALEDVPGPYWVPEAKRVSPEAFLRSELGKAQGKAPKEVGQAELQAANTCANRLRWMLKDTMGADGEFERRRAELAHMRGLVEVSDEDTAESFVQSVQPGGFMREYIELGELAKVIGNTLYVHGGVQGSFREGATVALGFVPSRERRGQSDRFDDLGAWVAGLQRFLDDERADWAARPLWTADASGGYRGAYAEGRRGGHMLMDYVVPGCLPSVVMARHLDSKGMPAPLPAEVEATLARCGVRRLVIGHTPHGNCPTVIKSKTRGDASVDVFSADTSYSDMKHPSGDNRGAAVSELSVLCDGSTRVRGVLEDGQTGIAYSVPPASPPPPAFPPPPPPNSALSQPAQPLVGLLIAGAEPGADPPRDFFVKALTQAGDYLLCNVSGFSVTYKTLSRAECLRKLGLPEDGASPDALPRNPTPSSPPPRSRAPQLTTLIMWGAVGAAAAVGVALGAARMR